MKTLREACASGEFLLTAECVPPKGSDISRFSEQGQRLLGKVHAVNVNDNPAAIMHASPLALSKVLLEMGHDPICQITGRDRNRLAIQSDLLGLQILGIRNVLCLRGDDVTVGNQKETKPVFDLASVGILKTVTDLNQGRDLGGHPLEGATDLFAGAAVSPLSDFSGPGLIQFKNKVEAGARFLQTQAVFDPEPFKQFMEMARQSSVKVIAGVLFLRSVKMAEYVNAHIPGIRVPDHFIERLARAGKEGAVAAGIDITLEVITSVRGLCDGVHLMAIGAEEQIPTILERAGLTDSGKGFLGGADRAVAGGSR